MANNLFITPSTTTAGDTYLRFEHFRGYSSYMYTDGGLIGSYTVPIFKPRYVWMPYGPGSTLYASTGSMIQAFQNGTDYVHASPPIETTATLPVQSTVPMWELGPFTWVEKSEHMMWDLSEVKNDTGTDYWHPTALANGTEYTFTTGLTLDEDAITGYHSVYGDVDQSFMGDTYYGWSTTTEVMTNTDARVTTETDWITWVKYDLHTGTYLFSAVWDPTVTMYNILNGIPVPIRHDQGYYKVSTAFDFNLKLGALGFVDGGVGKLHFRIAQPLNVSSNVLGAYGCFYNLRSNSQPITAHPGFQYTVTDDGTTRRVILDKDFTNNLNTGDAIETHCLIGDKTYLSVTETEATSTVSITGYALALPSTTLNAQLKITLPNTGRDVWIDRAKQEYDMTIETYDRLSYTAVLSSQNGSTSNNVLTTVSASEVVILPVELGFLTTSIRAKVVLPDVKFIRG